MHIENESAEIVAIGEHEFEEIIEEYEEEILMQEEVPEPSPIDSANTTPAQGKPWCITLIFDNHWIYIYIYIYMMCIYVIEILWKRHA